MLAAPLPRSFPSATRRHFPPLRCGIVAVTFQPRAVNILACRKFATLVNEFSRTGEFHSMQFRRQGRFALLLELL